MLQHFGTCQRAVLGDMSHQDDALACLLHKSQQTHSAVPHLGHRARERLALLRRDSLYRVDNYYVGVQVGSLLIYFLQRGLTQYVQLFAYLPIARQSLGSHLELTLALFAAHIEHLESFHLKHRLQQQRRLADTRLAAQQHQRPFHQSAAKHPVELFVAGVKSHLVGVLHLAQSFHGAALAVC